MLPTFTSLIHIKAETLWTFCLKSSFAATDWCGTLNSHLFYSHWTLLLRKGPRLWVTELRKPSRSTTLRNLGYSKVEKPSWVIFSLLTTYSASSKRLPMFFSGSAAGLWARMSFISLTFFSTESTVSRYGPITPLIFKALAFSRNLWVLLVSSPMITSQRAKHWWQGVQSGKTPEYPLVHLSQREPSTPSTQTHCPVDWSHCGVSIPLGSQSQAGKETEMLADIISISDKSRQLKSSNCYSLQWLDLAHMTQPLLTLS